MRHILPFVYVSYIAGVANAISPGAVQPRSLDGSFDDASSDSVFLPDEAASTQVPTQSGSKTTHVDEMDYTFSPEAIFRNPSVTASALLQHPVGFNARNTFDLFQHGWLEVGKESGGSFGFYKKGKYSWLKYGQMAAHSERLGKGIVNQGLHGPVRDGAGREWRMIGIYAEPGIAWAQTELAAAQQNVTLVPIYDTANPEFVASILSQTQVRTVFASPRNAGKLLDLIVARKPGINLSQIVIFGSPEDRVELMTRFGMHGVPIQLFEEVEFAGKAGQDHPPRPEDVNTLCFTSGTTGEPKGVVITHRMLIAAVGAAVQGGLGLTRKDVYFAFLPPAHIFARVVDLTLMYTGAKIGYFSGDKKDIGRDMKLVRPSVIAGVPRFLEKTLEKIQSATRQRGRTGQWLIGIALNDSNKIMNGLAPKDPRRVLPFVSAVTLNIIRAALGGKLRLILNGGGPLSATVHAQLKEYLHVYVAQGYGLTETTGASILQSPLSRTYGIVGAPLSCVEVKLADQDLHSKHGSGAGEIYMRGPTVFKEYFGNPEATATAFAEGGWFKTGDIAKLVKDEKGQYQFKIVGRSKEIFKLPNGEYVSPALVEGNYKLSDAVEDIVVDLAPSGQYLVALINVKPEYLAGHIKHMRAKAGKSYSAAEIDENLLNSKEFGLIDSMKSSFSLIMKSFKLSPNEKLEVIYVTTTSFGPGTEYQTATMKLKRSQLTELMIEKIAGTM